MLAPHDAEQIAHTLRRESPLPFAFLVQDQTVYVSRETRPITSLIQAIYDHRPDQARKILRSRIFTDVDPGESDLGMVKVAAKRITSAVLPKDHGIPLAQRFCVLRPLAPPPLLGQEDLPVRARSLLEEGAVMEAAFAIAESIPRQARRYESDRKVAAILVSRDGTLIAASRNSNARNRTRHAEVNLVQGLARERGMRIPPDASIFVTLKCCKMCAGMIWDSAEDPGSIRVFYGQEDLGPNARLTVFSGRGIEQQLAGRGN